MPHDTTELDLVFGLGEGATPRARARHSSKLFVRGLYQIGEYTPGAKGHRLTAAEALDAYGFDTLLEVATEGSALFTRSYEVPGKVLRERRTLLGLEIGTVAAKAHLTTDLVKAAEASRQLPIKQYEAIARILALDDRLLSTSDEPRGNERVAIR